MAEPIDLDTLASKRKGSLADWRDEQHFLALKRDVPIPFSDRPGSTEESLQQAYDAGRIQTVEDVRQVKQENAYAVPPVAPSPPPVAPAPQFVPPAVPPAMPQAAPQAAPPVVVQMTAPAAPQVALPPPAPQVVPPAAPTLPPVAVAAPVAPVVAPPAPALPVVPPAPIQSPAPVPAFAFAPPPAAAPVAAAPPPVPVQAGPIPAFAFGPQFAPLTMQQSPQAPQSPPPAVPVAPPPVPPQPPAAPPPAPPMPTPAGFDPQWAARNVLLGEAQAKQKEEQGLQTRDALEDMDSSRRSDRYAGYAKDFAERGGKELTRAARMDTGQVGDLVEEGMKKFGPWGEALAEGTKQARQFAAGLLETAQKLGQYDGNLAQAQALAEIKETLGDIARARMLGQDLGETTRIITSMSESIKNIQALVTRVFIPAFNTIASGITSLVELVESLVRYFLGREGDTGTGLDPMLDELLKPMSILAGFGRRGFKPGGPFAGPDPDLPGMPRRPGGFVPGA